MKKISSILFFVTAILTSFSVYAQSRALNSYEELMVNKIWITTDAIDNKGESISPSDSRVNSFFGIAQYSKDGTFTLLTPQGAFKLSGDWSINNDGLTRTLVAKDKEGKILFTRDVQNVTLTEQEYTYRIYPDSSDKTVYFDIVHKPLSNLFSEN